MYHCIFFINVIQNVDKKSLTKQSILAISPLKLLFLISCIVFGRVNTSGALGMFMGSLINLLCNSGTSIT